MKFFLRIILIMFLSFAFSIETQAQIDTLCFGSTLENYSITPNAGSTYSWSVSGGGVIVGSSVGTSIRLGESVLFSADVGYDTYNWTPSSLSGASSTYTPNAVADDTFEVEVIGEGGCSTTESIEIEIFELPSVEVSLSDSSICLGESITVSASSGFNTYTWTNSSLSNDQTTLTPGIGDTDYSVTVTDANGCEDSDDAVLTINEVNPVVLTVNGSNTTTICLGESISLEATADLGSYEWVPNVVIGDNGVYVPLNTTETSYTVTTTDADGCQSTDTINITINNLPNPGPIIFN